MTTTFGRAPGAGHQLVHQFGRSSHAEAGGYHHHRTEATRAPDAAEPEETHDDHADLQLQPDHAPGPQGPGPGAG